jgi:hypothetical protein
MSTDTGGLEEFSATSGQATSQSGRTYFRLGELDGSGLFVKVHRPQRFRWEVVSHPEELGFSARVALPKKLLFFVDLSACRSICTKLTLVCVFKLDFGQIRWHANFGKMGHGFSRFARIFCKKQPASV